MDEKLKKRGRRILFCIAVYSIMLRLDKRGGSTVVYVN